MNFCFAKFAFNLSPSFWLCQTAVWIQIQKGRKVLLWNQIKSRMEACYSELILPIYFYFNHVLFRKYVQLSSWLCKKNPKMMNSTTVSILLLQCQWGLLCASVSGCEWMNNWPLIMHYYKLAWLDHKRAKPAPDFTSYVFVNKMP